jgi:hypothetical protein
MKSIREMTADTEVYQQEIRRLVETDPKAEQIYIKMKAELTAARQLREDDARRSAVVCRHSGQRVRRGGLTCH